MKELLVNINTRCDTLYIPKLISISNGRISGCNTSSNLGYYLGYCSKELHDERIAPIIKAAEQYNDIVSYLWSLTGFPELFKDYNYFLSKNDFAKVYGCDITDYVFSLASPPFCYPDIVVKDDYLFLANIEYTASFELCEQIYRIRINGNADGYPSEMNNKICLWNWIDGETDFAICFVNYIYSQLPKGVSINDGPLYDFDCYDQWRGSLTAGCRLIFRILELFKHYGYLEEYKLFVESNSAIWNYYTETQDNSVGLYLLDKRAFKDKLLIAKINALMDACTITYDDDNCPIYGTLVDPATDSYDVTQRFYFLQDENDNTVVSKNPGLFGGHNRLKIYGRTDCPSAARHITNGKYIRHRVFFQDEKTAIAAGYRPCAVCMRDAYQKWKQHN